jgi:beta-phosphoglucomutase family hydrolase
MSRFSPQALIFDCDGTLADTMPLHWYAWRSIAERHGITLSEERLYSMGGIPSRDIVKMLSQEQGLSLDPLAIARDKEGLYRPLIDQVESVNVVVGIAREHFGRLPMAVASGGSREIIERVLHHLNIHHLFNAIVTNEDVQHQKPAPDIFLEAARRLGVPPEKCRAYEDTEIGMRAIRAAGMHAVHVNELMVR